MEACAPPEDIMASMLPLLSDSWIIFSCEKVPCKPRIPWSHLVDVRVLHFLSTENRALLSAPHSGPENGKQAWGAASPDSCRSRLKLCFEQVFVKPAAFRF